MLPSWIKSRNWSPRLVFLAIEITSRRFASVISRLARRAFASPVDIWRLISFVLDQDADARLQVEQLLLFLHDRGLETLERQAPRATRLDLALDPA